MYFPTLLAILGYLREDQDDEVVRKSSTYAVIARNGDANPIVYDQLNSEIIQSMRSSGVIIGRKFRQGSCDLSLWLSLVNDSGAITNNSPDTTEINIKENVKTDKKNNDNGDFDTHDNGDDNGNGNGNDDEGSNSSSLNNNDIRQRNADSTTLTNPTDDRPIKRTRM